LLPDEPIANLDLKHQIEVMKLLKDLVRKRMTVVIAIHDLNLASMFADKMIMMKNDKILAIGRSEDVIIPSNVKSVYGVKVKILDVNGIRVIVPNL